MFRFNCRVGEHSDSHWIGVSFDIPRERTKGSCFGSSLFVFGLRFADMPPADQRQPFINYRKCFDSFSPWP